MKLNIPIGGFLVAKFKGNNVAERCHRLQSNGAITKTFKDDGLVFRVWNEYPGQGLWWDDNACVAYDLDLSNPAELKKLVDLKYDDPSDLGFLIWKLYEKFGVDFIDKLRGAFGFALWDVEKEKLLVVTDPFGIKPVVFYYKNGMFSAGSRIQHVMLDPKISKEIDPEALYHFLFFEAICGPVTIYRDIKKLEPGKGILLANKSLNTFTHYDIQYRPDNSKSEKFWIDAIPHEVEKAVGKFVALSSYEKTGCFLSGGTDSSSIAGYYTKLAKNPAKTFSIGFDHPKYNELDFAHIAVDHFGTAQKEYYVTPQDVLSLIEELPRIYDEPFGNSSVVPAYYCARTAKENGVEVLLGGDGGDEIFGGNERYVTNLLFESYFFLPRMFRNYLLEPLIKTLPPVGPIRKAKRYIRRANFLNPYRFYSYRLLAEAGVQNVFSSEFLSHVDTNCFMHLANSLYNQAAPAKDTDRLLYLDMKLTITDNDLRKVNQMAETAGIQVRYPLLDRDLVDFTALIPPELKVKWRRNRYIFKRAMEKFLPKEIIKKQKHGMGLPIAVWFKTDSELSSLLNDTLFSAAPRIAQIVRPQFLKELESSFREDSTAYYGDSLWIYLILELWMRERKV